MFVPTSTLVNTNPPKQNISKHPSSRFVFHGAEEPPGSWSPFYLHIFLTNMEPWSSSVWPPSGLLCLFGTVGWSGCLKKVMIVKCDFLKTSLFVNNVTQHPLTFVQGLDHCPLAIPRVKPFSGMNFHVSFRGSIHIIIFHQLFHLLLQAMSKQIQTFLKWKTRTVFGFPTIWGWESHDFKTLQVHRTCIHNTLEHKCSCHLLSSFAQTHFPTVRFVGTPPGDVSKLGTPRRWIEVVNHSIWVPGSFETHLENCVLLQVHHIWDQLLSGLFARYESNQPTSQPPMKHSCKRSNWSSGPSSLDAHKVGPGSSYRWGEITLINSCYKWGSWGYFTPKSVEWHGTLLTTGRGPNLHL